MKKLVLVLLFLAVACGLWAEDSESPLGMDVYTGLWYDAVPIADNDLALFAAIFNLRAGAMVDLKLKPIKEIGLGAEVGLQFLSVDASGVSVTFLDIPVHAKVELNLADIVKLDIFGGPLFHVVTVSSDSVGSDFFGLGGATRINVGGRVILGPVFAEGSYAFSTVASLPSFPRFAIGADLVIVK